jgi:hypothetical protein
MKKKIKKSNYDGLGFPELNMPFVPDLGEFINPKIHKNGNLASGINRVTNAFSFGFNPDRVPPDRPQRIRRKKNLFERGRRLDKGEAPLNEYEEYQYRNRSDYQGGNNIF